MLSGKILMHKAVRPSNYFSNSFTYNQAEQIKKEVICVQILLEIHLTEHGRFSFSRSGNFLHTCLGPIQQAHNVKMTSKRRGDVTQTSVRRHFNVMHLQGSNVVFVQQV